GRVDGIPDAGRKPDDLARADAAQRGQTVFPGFWLEGSRLPDCGHAAGHGRCRVVDEFDCVGRGLDRRDHAVTGVAVGQPALGLSWFDRGLAMAMYVDLITLTVGLGENNSY